jgi:hypothetical protein
MEPTDLWSGPLLLHQDANRLEFLPGLAFCGFVFLKAMPSLAAGLSAIRLARPPSRSPGQRRHRFEREDHNYDEIRYRLLNHRRSIEMVKLPRGS